jgi:signal transduction histidine kinase
VSSATPPIFAGEGAARAAARAVDWSKTPVGAPETWPTSLRATLGILMSSRHPMFLWWGPELVQFYNDAYLPSFGLGKHPTAMGQRGTECWQEIWPIIFPQIDDVMARGKASWNENQLVPIHRNGRIEEVYWTYGYSPVFDESGRVGGVLVVCTETTAGVLAIRRLEFIRRLATALNHAHDAASVARIMAECLTQAKLDIPFSLIAAEGVPSLCVGLDGGEPPRLSEPESEEPLSRRRLERAIRCEQWPELVTHAVVHAFEGAPAGTLTFGLSPRLPFDEAYRSFLQQVSEQMVSAQGRVAIDLERRRLLDQAPVATALLTGPDHVYELANRRYVEMVGREVLGKRYIDAFPESRGTALLGIMDRVYRLGEAFSTQELLVRLTPDGAEKPEDRYFNFVLEPIRDVRGNVYGMMAVGVDITAQVTARSELQRNHEERAGLLVAAEAASRAKDEFLALLGHELRNPLAPIVTAVEVMKVKDAACLTLERQIIERQARHLVGLVDDLLDVSRVVAGKIELKKRRVVLGEVVTAAIEMASPLLEKRGHELRVDVAPGLYVDGDPSRLAQIISNLLTNAARYTDPGGQVVIAGWRTEEQVRLRVEDNGIGIPSEQLPRLFERFFQGDRPADRAQGGLGLGLALVKSLVELHGGSVRAESDGVGRGSAFELCLAYAGDDVPAAPLPAPARAALDATRAERVLLVDDNEDITDLFRTFLELNGFEVQTAHDGPSALRIAAAYKPTVAILDLGLPVMNGYDVAVRLVEQLGPAAPRLIAMSGFGRDDDVERTRFAGFERHLVKPVDSTTLLAALAAR